MAREGDDGFAHIHTGSCHCGLPVSHHSISWWESIESTIVLHTQCAPFAPSAPAHWHLCPKNISEIFRERTSDGGGGSATRQCTHHMQYRHVIQMRLRCKWRACWKTRQNLCGHDEKDFPVCAIWCKIVRRAINDKWRARHTLNTSLIITFRVQLRSYNFDRIRVNPISGNEYGKDFQFYWGIQRVFEWREMRLGAWMWRGKITKTIVTWSAGWSLSDFSHLFYGWWWCVHGLLCWLGLLHVICLFDVELIFFWLLHSESSFFFYLPMLLLKRVDTFMQYCNEVLQPRKFIPFYVSTEQWIERLL